ncbi:glycoside hydrolase family 16 protein [Mycena leptocephala]|nr:glycoside hydrolase family 16 protein [Mycena leptocephala]
MPAIGVSLLSLCLLLATASASIPQLDGYKIVWSDDFNGDQGASVDPSKWTQKVGPTGNNGELEVYTSGTNNVHLSGDGQVYIVPTLSDGTWSSGRLESTTAQSCADGGAMVFQAEILVPDLTNKPAKFAGLWPAFWALGDNIRTSGVKWPKCGEWDIFEVEYAGGQYHTWAFKVDRRNTDWTQQKLTWYLDGAQYYQVTGAMISTHDQWVQLAYDPYFPILNLAIGGDYPGFPTSQTVSGFEASMRVKYVAIYKTV